jgi:hypothetical protein
MKTTPPISRRSFLAMPLALAAIPKGAQGQAKKVPVGLELYSVRAEYMRDLPGTVTAVAKMGYEVVEFWAPYYQWTPAQAKDVRKLLDDLGIKCNSTHNSGEAVTPEGLKKAIELNQIIGSKNIIQASEPPQARTIDDWKALAAKLTSFSEQLKPLGMATGYHNHAREWPEAAVGRQVDPLRGRDTEMAGHLLQSVALQAALDKVVVLDEKIGVDDVASINVPAREIYGAFSQRPA